MSAIFEPRLPHVLWITERYPPLSGGMAVSAARQTAGLRGGGVPLDVLALTDAGPTIEIRESVREGGADFHVTRDASPGMTAQRLWRLVCDRHAVHGYDWVVGFGAGRPGHLAVTFAAWLGRPSLVMARGNDFDQDWFEPRALPVLIHSLGQATVVGAVSEEMAARIRALFPGQDVRMTPNGIDVFQWNRLPHEQRRGEEIRRELTADGRRVVGLFGEWKYKKRMPAWLDALRMAGLNDHVALLVVGNLDDPTRQILEDPVLSPPHRWIAFTSQDELPGLYAACDFVAMPSLYEGMPNVLLEAMASGVVPLVSSAGAMKTMVKDAETGFVFSPEDREAMADALRRALALSPAEHRAMGQRAKEFVASHYSLDNERAAILAILGKPGRSAS